MYFNIVLEDELLSVKRTHQRKLVVRMVVSVLIISLTLDRTRPLLFTCVMVVKMFI